MITVQVFSKNTGNPVKHTKVSLGFSGGLLRQTITDSEYTDADGEAHFDVKPGDGEVYVNGTVKKEGRLAGRIVIYI